MFTMSHSFILLGGNDKKLILENATHPCPRCKRADTVQLTRSESCFIIFNKRIELPNSMRVRYECRKCHWKNETLPDDDPSFQTMPYAIDEREDDLVNNHSRQDSIGYSSFVSSITSTSSTQNYKRNGTLAQKRSSFSY